MLCYSSEKNIFTKGSQESQANKAAGRIIYIHLKNKVSHMYQYRYANF